MSIHSHPSATSQETPPLEGDDHPQATDLLHSGCSTNDEALMDRIDNALAKLTITAHEPLRGLNLGCPDEDYDDVTDNLIPHPMLTPVLTSDNLEKHRMDMNESSSLHAAAGPAGIQMLPHTVETPDIVPPGLGRHDGNAAWRTGKSSPGLIGLRPRVHTGGSSVCSRAEITRIVADMDSNVATSQLDFESWKKDKWGESLLESVNIDPEDFDLEVLGDVMVPTSSELLRQARFTLTLGYVQLSSALDYTQSQECGHRCMRYIAEIWYSLLDYYEIILYNMKNEGRSSLGGWVLIMALIDLLITVVDTVVVYSGIKFLLSVFDRPILLKIAYLPTAEHPESRFTTKRTTTIPT